MNATSSASRGGSRPGASGQGFRVGSQPSEDTTRTVHDIARDEQVTPDYLYVVLRLRWLAPDITSAIINGRQPPQLKRLMRLIAQLPAD